MDENNSIQLFEDRKIRTAWDEEQEEWYFSVVDVIAVLTDSSKATPHKLQSFRLAEVYQHILWITSAVLPAKAH